MPMNNRLMVPRKTPGLLDLVPGAAAAYSLRSMSNSYAGPVVTVRRSSDNAEDSFTAAEVSDGTLAAFCGAGDGFVKTWHSQTGSNDATQTTAAYQPKIVSSGVVITEEGKPAIQFDGSDDRLAANGLAAQFSGSDKVISYAAVATINTANTLNRAIFGFGRSSVDTPFIWTGAYSVNNTFRLSKSDDSANAINALGSVQDALENQSLLFGFSDGDGGVVFHNSASSASGAQVFGTVTLDLFSVGALPRTSTIIHWLGVIQEIVIYPSDQTANRELIEGNIAWSYSV